MAKQTGLGWTTFSVDDAGGTPRDIRSSTKTLEFDTPREPLEVTGIDKSAYERLLGLADFTITAEGVFDPAVNASHAVLCTVTSTGNPRTVAIGVGGKSLSNETLFTTYALTREDDGGFNWSAEGSLADGTVPTWV